MSRTNLLVGKIKDYQANHPDLQSPDVNWDRFNDNWTSRVGFADIETALNGIDQMCNDPRILHDYELYQAALKDYEYAQYKTGVSSDSRYSTKVADVKQFFPHATGSNKPKANPPV